MENNYKQSVTAADDLFMRAKVLVEHAYTLPELEREAWINNECTDDPALRKEIQWLLEGLRSPEDDFLTTSSKHVLDALYTLNSPQTGMKREGDRANLNIPAGRSYTILRPLGEGGSGLVYLAERTENETRQILAIKLLSPLAMRNQSALVNFLRERKLLAQLNHPRIARLIDAGALDDGQPFIAMEYVDGQAIDQYCQDKNLSLKARLYLFLMVCEAVQYAHQQFVIHRDIKPSNVLVASDGEPKLVDFGIARALEAEAAQAAATEGGAMSFRYASPEQIAGQPLSTSTDVYSLGVLLYELVVGQTPWHEGDGAALLAKRICAVEPELPSKIYQQRVAKTGRLQARQNKLSPDLDAIVLKAMRHLPKDRYGSVQGLADDVNRLLKNYPVIALQGRRSYVIRKFATRHWHGFMGAVFVLVMIIAFGILQTVQLERVRQEEIEVKKESGKFRQVSEFLGDLLTLPMPEYTQGKEITALALIDHGANRLRQLPDIDPSTKIKLYSTMARTYLALGDLDQASDLASQAVQLAHESPNISRQELMNALLSASKVERLLPDGVLMDKFSREAIALANEDLSIDRISLADALQWQAYSQFLLGNPISEVEKSFYACIALFRRVAPDSAETVIALTDLATAQARFGKAEDAWPIQQSASEMAERILGPNHPDTLRNKAVTGSILGEVGEAAQAEVILRSVIAAQTKLLGAQHAQTNITLGYLVNTLLAQGKWAEAEQVGRSHLENTRKLRHYKSLSTYYALLRESDALNSIGQFDRAERNAREAEVVAEETYGKENGTRWRAVAQVLVAKAQLGRNKPDLARDLLRDALKNLPAMPDTLQYRVRAWMILGEVESSEKNDVAAQTAFQTGYDLAPTTTFYQPFIALDWGRFLFEHGQSDQAIGVIAPLLKRLEVRMPTDAPVLKETRFLLETIRNVQSYKEHHKKLLRN